MALGIGGEHHQLTLDELQPLHAFEFATAADRLAHVYAKDDVGKAALDLATGTFWILSDHDPQTWSGFGGGAGGGAGLTWHGVYNPAVGYALNDAVYYQGSAYIATGTVLAGTAPPAAPWSLIVQKGSDGAPGVDGAPGTPGATGATGATGP